MPNDIDAPMFAAYKADQSATAFAEIVKLLPKLTERHVLDLLKGMAATCEAMSSLEDDDFEVIAVRLDECLESLNDELGGEVESDDRLHNSHGVRYG